MLKATLTISLTQVPLLAYIQCGVQYSIHHGYKKEMCLLVVYNQYMTIQFHGTQKNIWGLIILLCMEVIQFIYEHRTRESSQRYMLMNRPNMTLGLKFLLTGIQPFNSCVNFFTNLLMLLIKMIQLNKKMKIQF